MDMKRILQALDGASTKPVEGAKDMSKFLSVIDNASKPETLTEGANPHKVSLPVQMAMQHYQKPQVEKKKRPALIDKYFKQVEDEIVEEKLQKRQLINQYASTIAQRVLMKEGKGEGKMHISPSGVKTNMPPTDDDYAINYGKNGLVAKDRKARGVDVKTGSKKVEAFNPRMSSNPGFEPGPGPGIQSPVAEEDNQVDTITVDVPLMIRLLEYAREDAKTDMDLHDVAERLIALAQDGNTLTMDDYDSIMGNNDQVDEGRKIKAKRKSDPCWSDYHQVGMQKKDGRMVPKCVPRVSKKDK